MGNKQHLNKDFTYNNEGELKITDLNQTKEEKKNPLEISILNKDDPKIKKENPKKGENLCNIFLIRDQFIMQEREISEFEILPDYISDIEKIWINKPLESNDCPILKLPLVLIWEISYFLYPREIVSWESTCTHFRLKFNKNPDFWKSIYYTNFISLPSVSIPKSHESNPWKYVFNLRMKSILCASKILEYIKNDGSYFKVGIRNSPLVNMFYSLTGILLEKEDVTLFLDFYKNYLLNVESDSLKKIVNGRYLRMYKLTHYLKIHYSPSYHWRLHEKKLFRRECRAAKFLGCVHISKLFVSIMLIKNTNRSDGTKSMQNELLKLFDKEKNVCDTRRIIQLMRKHTLLQIEKILELNQKKDRNNSPFSIPSVRSVDDNVINTANFY